MNSQRGLFLIALGSAAIVLGACTDCTMEDQEIDCFWQEGAWYPTNTCNKIRKEYCADIDAGPDAAVCKREGLAIESRGRDGECVLRPAPGWSEPQAVWFGAIDDAPTSAPELGSVVDQYYFDLHTPTSIDCPECSCSGPTGKCSIAVDYLAFHNAACGFEASETTDVTPLSGWDGSCSTDDALGKGDACPVGSGIPCAQAFTVSALPKPEQHCEPVEIPVPKAIADLPHWKQTAVVYQTLPTPSSAELRDKYPKNPNLQLCIPQRAGWHTCVRAKEAGIVSCDLATDQVFIDEKGVDVTRRYNQQHVVYMRDAIENNRTCGTCTCTPTGGVCEATLRFYEDQSCTQEAAMGTMDSESPYCHDLPLLGAAMGSKDATNLKYFPGACKATRGEPLGDVTVNDDLAFTWCCAEGDASRLFYDIDQ